MSPLHSPFPSTSPAVVPAPWDPTAEPTLEQTGTVVGDGAQSGDGKRSHCRDPLQMLRAGTVLQGWPQPLQKWLSHTPAPPLPQGCPCLTWPQWGEQGRDTRGIWFGGAGLNPTLQDLESWEGSIPPCALGRHFPQLVTTGWGAGLAGGLGQVEER